jgi:hypothetical protein
MANVVDVSTDIKTIAGEPIEHHYALPLAPALEAGTEVSKESGDDSD